MLWYVPVERGVHFLNNFCCVHHVITYQHKALQMPEALKQKALLRANKGVISWQKFPIYFLWSIILCNACTDKLQAVHFL